MSHTTISRPAPDEHAPYYGKYIARVQGEDALAALIGQIDVTSRLLEGLDEARAMHRYAPGKWSVKQVVGHISDGERVFAYRALRFARADATPLPGFDENHYVPNGGFDARPIADLALEYRTVRSATIALFAGLTPEALGRRGVANDTPMSVRALAWTIAGHELHHRGLLIERYGLA